MNKFDYAKPEVLSFASIYAGGESCYIDCTNDSLCPGEDDEV